MAELAVSLMTQLNESPDSVTPMTGSKTPMDYSPGKMPSSRGAVELSALEK